MTNDSDATTHKPTTEPTTSDSTDRDDQWNDTIDDWDAVLEADDPTQATSDESTPDEASSTETETVKPSWETNTEDPFSDVVSADQDGETTESTSAARGEDVDTQANTESSATDSTEADSETSVSAASDTSSTDRADSKTASTDRADSETAATDSATKQFSPTDSDSEFVRIDPISDPLLRSTVQVLPEPWLEDTDIQQLVQWVVYAYIEQTDQSLATTTRIEEAIEYAADRTEMSASTARMLCTTSLYRGKSGVPVDNFQSDLTNIARRLTAVS